MQYDSYSQEETHMVQAIVGANWGDEGKGKITDMLVKKPISLYVFREEQMQAIRS